MSSELTEIDTIARNVVEVSKEVNEAGKACAEVRNELNQLFDALVGEKSSTEVKQKFQVVAMDLADKGVKVGELRKQLREVSNGLLEKVKADGRSNITTVDGVELTLDPTLQFKMPEPKKEEEGVEEKKEE